jgi:large subunit ribosomal protein L6
MADIFNKVIKLPVDLKVTKDSFGTCLTFDGVKGKLELNLPKDIQIVLHENSTLEIVPSLHKTKLNKKALIGTIASKIIRNIEGVTQGFKVQLNLVGVGYRAAVEEDSLILKLGYSHDILIPITEGLDINVNKRTSINIKGADYELITKFAAKIRSYRLPEPYKGKGILYKGEAIQLKEGKKN